jgi:hypothetical protein
VKDLSIGVNAESNQRVARCEAYGIERKRLAEGEGPPPLILWQVPKAEEVTEGGIAKILENTEVTNWGPEDKGKQEACILSGC